MLIYENRPPKMKFFLVPSNFFMNFDFKNECKNEFKDNNEKSCSLSRNRISHKIDFKGVWPRNGHTDSVGVKEGVGCILELYCLKIMQGFINLTRKELVWKWGFLLLLFIYLENFLYYSFFSNESIGLVKIFGLCGFSFSNRWTWFAILNNSFSSH